MLFAVCFKDLSIVLYCNLGYFTAGVLKTLQLRALDRDNVYQVVGTNTYLNLSRERDHGVHDGRPVKQGRLQL